MAAIKSAAAIAQKWATVTPLRAQDYTDGITNPRTDWAQATVAANDAWKTGISNAVANDSFRKGVNNAGTQAWQTATLAKGPQRWQSGVQIGQPAFERGFAPYREAIAGLTLPPRFARRDPRNLDRVKAVVDAMIRVKTGASSRRVA